MSHTDCVICNKQLDDSEKSVVREKGLKTFIVASKKRQDGKFLIFNKSTKIEVHERCRKDYIDEKCISASLKKAQQNTETKPLRSRIPDFDFRTHCFLCGEEVPVDYAKKQIKKPPSKRNLVYPVRKLAVRENVLKLVKNRSDDFGRSVIQRIEPVTDLVAADAQYHVLCMKTLYLPQRSLHEIGRPPGLEVEDAMQNVYRFLESSDEECQFTMEELMEQITDDFRPHPNTVKRHLLQKYGDDIIITTCKPYVVCFKATGHKAITDSWYQDVQRMSEKEEKLALVKAAAAIILGDIRSQVYNLTKYPSPEKFLDETDDLIPETLRVFIDALVLSKKRGDLKKWKNKSINKLRLIYLSY